MFESVDESDYDALLGVDDSRRASHSSSNDSPNRDHDSSFDVEIGQLMEVGT